MVVLGRLALSSARAVPAPRDARDRQLWRSVGPAPGRSGDRHSSVLGRSALSGFQPLRRSCVLGSSTLSGSPPLRRGWSLWRSGALTPLCGLATSCALALGHLGRCALDHILRSGILCARPLWKSPTPALGNSPWLCSGAWHSPALEQFLRHAAPGIASSGAPSVRRRADPALGTHLCSAARRSPAFSR